MIGPTASRYEISQAFPSNELLFAINSAIHELQGLSKYKINWYHELFERITEVMTDSQPIRTIKHELFDRDNESLSGEQLSQCLNLAKPV